MQLMISSSLTDPSLSHSNVASVLSSISTRDLPRCLDIPKCVRVKITDQYNDDRDQRHQFVTCYLQYSPYSTSWTCLAGDLHLYEKTTAELMVSKFLHGTRGVGVAYVCRNVEAGY